MALDPKKISQRTAETINDIPKIITASLDNTIRLWNSKKMDVANVLGAPPESEVSAMTFLMNSCLVVTGHEDGTLRLWNLEISSSILLKSSKGGQHSNTISCVMADMVDDEEKLFAGSYDGLISCWEITTKGQNKKQASSQATEITA